MLDWHGSQAWVALVGTYMQLSVLTGPGERSPA